MHKSIIVFTSYSGGGVLFKTLDKNQGSLNEGEIGTNDLENT